MEENAQTIQKNVPYTWQMIQQLLDANSSCCQIQPEACDPEVMDEEILAEFECDLGDIKMESKVNDKDGLACRKRR
jgi:hypothetical protein